ncbi:MAG: tetratricopeptide repeat protein [Planctomycetes bacterium]|nr:tetratricopeptide repeat protein [Planctomycetota bacterium]
MHRSVFIAFALSAAAFAEESGAPGGQDPGGAGAAPASRAAWNVSFHATGGHTGKVGLTEEGQWHDGPGPRARKDAASHFHPWDPSTGTFGPGVALDGDRKPLDAEGEGALKAALASQRGEEAKAQRPRQASAPRDALFSEPRTPIRDEVEAAILALDWDRAIAAARLAEEPYLSPVFRLVAAHACLARNRNDESFALFRFASGEGDLQAWDRWTEELSVRNAGHVAATYLRADALARQRRWEEALRALRIVVVTTTEVRDCDSVALWTALVLNARAAVACALEDHDSALVDLEDARRLCPGLADAHASAGTRAILLSDGAPGASKAFRAALEISPAFSLALNGRGCTEVVLGDFDQAETTFAEVLERPLCEKIAEHNLSRLYKLRKDWILSEAEDLAKAHPGTVLQKVHVAAQMFENKFHEMNNRLGIAGHIGLKTLTGTANTFFEMGGKLQFGLSKTGPSISLGIGNPKAYAPLNDFQQKYSSARIGELHTNISNLQTQFKGLQAQIQQPGGVDTRVPADPLRGKRWGLVTFFGLYYEILPESHRPSSKEVKS